MNEKIKENSNKIYSNIVNNYNEYCPFTEKKHQDIFEILKNRFERHYRGRLRINITKEYFEKTLSDKYELEQSYVDVYSKNAHYQLFHLNVEGQNFEFYVMTENKIILLIFFKMSNDNE